MFRGGLGFAPSLIYKVTTQDAYSGVMRSWFDFLAQGRRPRPHINGALLEDLQGGMILAKLLVGYLWWLRGHDIPWPNICGPGSAENGFPPD